MDYILKFDNREKELIKILNENGYMVETENLDLGDIQFLDLKTKEIIIIIERKTLPDLAASIKDGRYKEQKERLRYSIGNRVRKIVLLEGTNLSDFSLSEKAFKSVIINTLIRDNIHIHITKNTLETFEFIENIMINLPKYYEELKIEVIDGIMAKDGTEHNIQKVKKDNLTPEICFRNMFSQINGISGNIANIYVKKYNSMKNFILEMEKLEINDKIQTLADEKAENGRRIGEKLANKICIYLLGISEEELEKKPKKTKKTKKTLKSMEELMKSECMFSDE